MLVQLFSAGTKITALQEYRGIKLEVLVIEYSVNHNLFIQQVTKLFHFYKLRLRRNPDHPFRARPEVEIKEIKVCVNKIYEKVKLL